MIISLHDYLKNLMEKELQKNQIWNSDDFFFLMRQLTIDQRGRVGEYFFWNVFKELNFNVEYIDNSHGDYDLIVDGLKIEVKTATLDVNSKFQHEGIKESKKWDYVAFLDISPNHIYVTFIHNSLFTFGLKEWVEKTAKKDAYEKIYGTFFVNNIKYNCHFRGKDNQKQKATGAGYKVDFKKKDLILTKTIKDFENTFRKSIKRN